MDTAEGASVESNSDAQGLDETRVGLKPWPMGHKAISLQRPVLTAFYGRPLIK
jgi:hypothetical protein